MGKVLKALDGRKRIIMVLFFAGASLAGMVTGQDYRAILETILGVFGWDPADAAVSSAAVATFVAAAWAVVDGLRKNAAAAKADGQK